MASEKQLKDLGFSEKEEVIEAPDLSAIEVEKKGKKEEEEGSGVETSAPAKEEKTEKPRP